MKYSDREKERKKEKNVTNAIMYNIDHEHWAQTIDANAAAATAAAAAAAKPSAHSTAVCVDGMWVRTTSNIEIGETKKTCEGIELLKLSPCALTRKKIKEKRKNV